MFILHNDIFRPIKQAAQPGIVDFGLDDATLQRLVCTCPVTALTDGVQAISIADDFLWRTTPFPAMSVRAQPIRWITRRRRANS
jgi:hypothetical protein